MNHTPTALNNSKNQLLINAIKTEFSNQNVKNGISSSPSTFTIPTLKVGDDLSTFAVLNVQKQTDQRGVSGGTVPNESTTKLNQFLLNQLKKKQAANDENSTENCNGILLPKLQLSGVITNTDRTYPPAKAKFDIPLIKTNVTTQTSNTNVGNLSSEFNKLDFNGSLTVKPSTPNIDLTTALATATCKEQFKRSGKVINARSKTQLDDDVDFDIPFIECDRQDTFSKKYLLDDVTNEHCQIDVSHVILKYNIAQPSPLGRLLTQQHRIKSITAPILVNSSSSTNKKVKHKIVPFQFDTKSPDDLILAALKRPFK
uniref:Uncharacterized protein n=1 Tax=Glossina austeni TaxID=7395 RepID=A0A1A9VWT2_GLOAU